MHGKDEIEFQLDSLSCSTTGGLNKCSEIVESSFSREMLRYVMAEVDKYKPLSDGVNEGQLLVDICESLNRLYEGVVPPNPARAAKLTTINFISRFNN